jgi:hypothetical protein
MATSEQVAAADTAGRGSGPSPRFNETRSEHQTGGASVPLPAWQTEITARLMARDAPDMAAMLGLTLPEVFTPADAVVAASVAGGPDGVRMWAAGADRDRLDAARRGLAERRAQRGGR